MKGFHKYKYPFQQFYEKKFFFNTMTSIEGLAQSWLVDPPWIKVFKHTFDILEDYVSYILVSLGAITLSVRLLTTLGIGDVVCLIGGVIYDNVTDTTCNLGMCRCSY